MRNIRLTPQARLGFLAEENFSAAERLNEHIDSELAKLEAFYAVINRQKKAPAEILVSV